MKIDVINASCAFSRLKGRSVKLQNIEAVISKNHLTGRYSMRFFGLTDDQWSEIPKITETWKCKKEFKYIN